MDLSEIIKPRQTVVLLIDLQRDFLALDGLLSRKGQDTDRMRSVIEPIKTLLAMARRVQIPIFFTQFVDGYRFRNSPGRYMFQKKELRETELACREGTDGMQFSDILPNKNDEIIIKHNYDSFAETGLEEILKKRNIQTLVIGGVKTNACVETTIRSAYEKGFYTIVPKECVASNTEREHKASLFNINRYFGDVVDLSVILEIWGNIKI